jgi:pilus assembly protein FimV
MIRKLSLAVAVATALSPMGLYALGLGAIHTHSALNQEFKADIDLLSTTKEELQNVRVVLASQKAFTKAGIDRPFLLTGLEFTPSITADGRPVISVTSRDPIREPFLNFLIEVNWPKGRLVREYTVLLDPPVTLERTPAPVQAPRVAVTPASERAPVNRSVTKSSNSYIPPAVSPFSAAERVYGPVQTNDNLWHIAQSLRQGNETVEQVMMALLRYNPDAFIENNVNLLKTGKILRLPEDADVTALSPGEARKEFLAQTREWRDQVAQESAVVGDAAQQTQPTMLSQDQQNPEDRLELVAPKVDQGEQSLDQEGDAEQGNQVERLQKQLMIANEENASAQLENKALQTRISELEGQLEDMQRLLTLRNDQMAELQTAQRLVEQQPETEATEASVQPQPSLPPEQAEETAVEGVETQVAETGGDEQVIHQVNIEQVIAESLKAEHTPSATPPAAESSAVENAPKAQTGEAAKSSPAETEKPAVVPPPALTKTEKPNQPQTQPKPQETSDLLDTLLGNPTLLGLAGGVVVLLLILFGLIMRRRKEAEAEFAESILVTPDGETAMSSSGGSVAAMSDTTEETSFMSEFSPSDIDALQDETGEVDPISEADVYIAYGRYQQAEELIKQAIERFPEREELKHKLLEIYYSAKNEAKFSSLAAELKQAGMEQEKPDLWEKVVTMGRELNPSNALYVGAAGLTAGLAQSNDDDGLDDLGLNLDSDILDEQIMGADAKSSAESDKPKDETDSLDFSGLAGPDEVDSDNLDLGGLALDSEFLNSLEAAEAANIPDQQPVDSLDVDLDELGSTVERSQLAANEDDLALASSLDGLSELSEFQIEDTPQDALETEGDNIVGLENSESLDDLDLESLEKELEMLSGDLQADEEPEQEKKPSEANLDVLDLANQAETSSMLSDDLDLNATDEVTTKLDLARAYVDMGDAEGAKSILEEVVTEGSNDQVLQAKELLEALSA